MVGVTCRPVVLFDLDGTLADPGDSIVSSVVFALEQLTEPVPSAEVLHSFVGPPLVASFGSLGMPRERIDAAIDLYRAHFDAEGVRLYRPYPGVPELIDELRATGVIVGVATSKPTPIAERVLNAMGWRAAFDIVSGATMDSTISSKADIIEVALNMLSEVAVEPVSLVMIGDRHHDIDGARAHGIQSIGVTWGYGDHAELAAAGADVIVADAAALADVLAAATNGRSVLADPVR